MAEERYDDLVRDLTGLGRGIDPPALSHGLTTDVMERIAALPTPGRRAGAWTRMWRQVGHRVADGAATRRRRIALVTASALLALLATPPVRAAVVDWFGFGSVLVERGEPGPGSAPPPPEVGQDLSVRAAAAAVDFAVRVPAALGVPDGVEVSSDKRRVSMSWASDEDGPVRLDQFGAGLDFSVLKVAPEVMYTSVGQNDALWFEEPHEVVLLEPDGSTRTESARLAGHTLVWLDDAATLRLEGDLTLERAVEIAASSVPVD